MRQSARLVFPEQSLLIFEPGTESLTLCHSLRSKLTIGDLFEKFPFAIRQNMSAPKKPKAEAPAKHDKDGHGAEGAPEAKKGGGLKGKLLIGAFVSFIVVAETVVFFFMVPSGEEVAALAESRLIAVAQEIDSKKTQEQAHDDSDAIVEFFFGTEPFSVSFIPPGADNPYRVEFELFGTLRKADEEKLKALYEERVGRFKARMLLEIRNASLQELQENQLGLIQRRVLATSTELLGEPILLSVGFSKYQVLEE